eukprot:TRINITY_DN3485_c3_g1_i1.p1 TRINITY_DN3485_c3_g1~~TRINITY_DN3485_c3_g1_i1.p1  ORF type:complete len:414 (-),score=122.36 TRINITY_DN3485_c3_g1_i1:37-1278(-)
MSDGVGEEEQQFQNDLLNSLEISIDDLDIDDNDDIDLYGEDDNDKDDINIDIDLDIDDDDDSDEDNNDNNNNNNNSKICKFLNDSGYCRTQTCKFAHPPNISICKFILKYGRCKNEKCNYQHPNPKYVAETAKNYWSSYRAPSHVVHIRTVNSIYKCDLKLRGTICKWYKEGYCKSKNCRYQHKGQFKKKQYKPQNYNHNQIYNQNQFYNQNHNQNYNNVDDNQFDFDFLNNFDFSNLSQEDLDKLTDGIREFVKPLIEEIEGFTLPAMDETIGEDGNITCSEITVENFDLPLDELSVKKVDNQVKFLWKNISGNCSEFDWSISKNKINNSGSARATIKKAKIEIILNISDGSISSGEVKVDLGKVSLKISKTKGGIILNALAAVISKILTSTLNKLISEQLTTMMNDYISEI